MHIRKGIVWLLTLALLAGLMPMQALATSSVGSKTVCYGKDGVTYSSHQWGAWTVVKEADCNHSGMRVRKCKRCGAEDTEYIAKAHEFGEWKMTKAPTCKEDGEEVRQCAKCGEIATRTVKRDPNAHVWSSWVVMTPPTEDALGMRRRECIICGVEQQEVFTGEEEFQDVDDDIPEEKKNYVFPILTGSFEDRIYYPGETVWIDLTLENVNPTDTVHGVVLEWYDVSANGEVADEPFYSKSMPDLILMPGESHSIKHQYHFVVDEEYAAQGTHVLFFIAWCHSVTYEWNANCSWSGVISMALPEEKGLSVDVTFDPGAYHVEYWGTPDFVGTVQDLMGTSSSEQTYTGDVKGHVGETTNQSYQPLPGSFSADVNVNNESHQDVDVTVTSDHPEDYLDGEKEKSVHIPARGTQSVDLTIVPTEEETKAGHLTRTVTATALENALYASAELSFSLRDGGWKLVTDLPGLTVTAGEVSKGWSEEYGSALYTASVKVENTGDLPLSVSAETLDGTGDSPWHDQFIGWADGVDEDNFLPGESFTFDYAMLETESDRTDFLMRRTLNISGYVQETGAFVTDSVSFAFPAWNLGELKLQVNRSHRTADAAQPITADLTLTNIGENTVTVGITVYDEAVSVTGDSLMNWPAGGTVQLAPAEKVDFSVVIHPTEGDMINGAVRRTVVASGASEGQEAAVTLVYPLVAELGQTAILFLDGEMTSAPALGLNDAFEAHVTATNLGNVALEDVVIHGMAQGPDGKCLAQLTLGYSGDGIETAPGEGVQGFPAFVIDKEMALSALSAKCVNEFAQAKAIVFSFWAQYTLRHDEGGVESGVSNALTFTVPILEGQEGGITLTGNYDISPMPKAGDPIDFHLTVKNAGKEDLSALRLDVYRLGGMGSAFLQTLVNDPMDIFHAGEERTYDFSYTIQPQDEDAGMVGFLFTAGAESMAQSMIYEASWEFGQWLDDTQEDVRGEGTILVEKAVISSPPDDQTAYRLNDLIQYVVIVTNTYPFAVANIGVYDDMTGYASPVLIGLINLSSGESVSIPFVHAVTAQDVDAQQVENVAYAQVVINDSLTDEPLEDYTVWSTPVVVPVEELVPLSVTITKIVTSTSKDPNGYQQGETIDYSIIVCNDHDTDALVDVWDWIDGQEAPDLVAQVTLGPGETQNFSHSYTVGPDDEIAQQVTNEAFAGVLLYPEDAEKTVGYTVWANPVTVPVIPALVPPVTRPPVTEEPLIPPETVTPDVTPMPQAGDDSFCRRVLTGKGNSEMAYELIFCEQHRSVELAARALPDEQAKELWTEAVNACYDALAQKYPGDTAALIEEERILFFDQLAAFQALAAAQKGDEEAVAFAVEQLRERCLDLCCALHTAPEDRLDSMRRSVPTLPEKGELPEKCLKQQEETASGSKVTYRYCREHLFIHTESEKQCKAGTSAQALAGAFRKNKSLWQSALMTHANALYREASAEGKAAIADALNLFLQWTAAREKALLALYPQDEAVAAEIAAFAMQGRAMDLADMRK